MATINAVGNGLSGISGSGAFTGNISPVITTPQIGQINDTNGNEMLELITTASAVNYLQMSNSATGSAPSFYARGSDSDVSLIIGTKGASGFLSLAPNSIQALGISAPNSSVNSLAIQASTTTNPVLIYSQGSDTNVKVQISAKGNAGVAVQGVSDGSNASAGYVGEFVTASVFASPVNITTLTATDMTSISLTSGDWDVWGNIYFTGAVSTVVNQLNAWVSSTSASYPNGVTLSRQDYGDTGSSSTGGVAMGLPISPLRFSLSSTTTIYISGYTKFSISTLSMIGFISARRVR